MSVHHHEAWLRACEDEVRTAFERIERVAHANQGKVLEAFWAQKVSTTDLHGSTGYGLDDEGRDKLERIYAAVFEADSALVRPQIISGTHALRLGLFGVCRPGDHIVFATGEPYDTLQAVVGLRPALGSLAEWGISSTVVPLLQSSQIDETCLFDSIDERTKLIMFQRSRGYSNRKALSISELASIFEMIKRKYPHMLIGVDNCYGEFTEVKEPTAVGADFAMGSLIKNPGGGIASTGGYIVGQADLMNLIAAQMTAPGIGAEAGPTHDFLRSFYQGLFMAPHVVSQALKGSVLASYVFEQLGFETSPKWHEQRSDLIVATEFKSRERLLAFCRAVQASAPVDAYVIPQAGHMAGYADDVVMAAGSFVQGGSLELSADGPMRPPYTGYFQGGLTYEHVFYALLKITQALNDMN